MLLVLSGFVFMHPAVCGPQEMTTGRRPTIQTTVTVLLTKSSLGACNQMLPVRFASKFVFCNYNTFELKVLPSRLLSVHFNGASHYHLYPSSSLFYIYLFIHHPSIPVILWCCSCLSLLGRSIWTPTVVPECVCAHHCLCPLIALFLKVLSLQSCCTGGCLDSSTTQALSAGLPAP